MASRRTMKQLEDQLVSQQKQIRNLQFQIAEKKLQHNTLHAKGNADAVQSGSIKPTVEQLEEQILQHQEQMRALYYEILKKEMKQNSQHEQVIKKDELRSKPNQLAESVCSTSSNNSDQDQPQPYNSYNKNYVYETKTKRTKPTKNERHF